MKLFLVNFVFTFGLFAFSNLSEKSKHLLGLKSLIHKASALNLTRLAAVDKNVEIWETAAQYSILVFCSMLQ